MMRTTTTTTTTTMSAQEPSTKRQKLSQSSVNHSIDSLVLSQITSQQSIETSAFNPLSSLGHDQIIIIKKNDNIKKRINQILKLLKNASDDFMLCSQSTNIQKLLTILEIVKQKINTQENVVLGDETITLKHDKYVQYNRLDSIKSRFNPNYKTTKKAPLKQELRPLNDDEGFTAEHLKELGVIEEKVYKIPILYVYLKSCSAIEKDESLISSGWTFQCSV